MTNRERGKQLWAAGILAAAVLMLICVYVLPTLADSDESSACEQIKQYETEIASGQNPGGRTWKVKASSQGDCRHSLLGWQFLPSGGVRGSWRGAWSIPTGGHLAGSATIAARDEVSDSARAFTGVVGGDVTKVLASTENGQTLVIHPKLPARSLRQKFRWLRHVRYIVRFYPMGDQVKRIELLKGDGEVKYSAPVVEGSVEGPMSAF